MTEYGAYVGLDVRKDTIAITVALPGREKPICWGWGNGEIQTSMRRLIRKLSPDGEVISSCHEGSLCGYRVMTARPWRRAGFLARRSARSRGVFGDAEWMGHITRPQMARPRRVEFPRKRSKNYIRKLT